MEKVKSTNFIIRKFQPGDGESCFRIRAEAFIKLFYDEIGPDGVAAGINAYMPDKYEKMSEQMPIFLAVDGQSCVGFITLQFLNPLKPGTHLKEWGLSEAKK